MYSGIISKGQIKGCDLCNIGQDLFNSLQRSSSRLPVLPLALGDEKIGHRQWGGLIISSGNCWENIFSSI